MNEERLRHALGIGLLVLVLPLVTEQLGRSNDPTVLAARSTGASAAPQAGTGDPDPLVRRRGGRAAPRASLETTLAHRPHADIQSARPATPPEPASSPPPRTPREMYVEAYTLFASGKPEEVERARVLFETILAEEPEFVLAHYWLGHLHLDQGDVEAARRHGAALEDLDPERGLTRALLEDIERRQGHRSPASEQGPPGEGDASSPPPPDGGREGNETPREEATTGESTPPEKPDREATAHGTGSREDRTLPGHRRMGGVGSLGAAPRRKTDRRDEDEAGPSGLDGAESDSPDGDGGSATDEPDSRGALPETSRDPLIRVSVENLPRVSHGPVMAETRRLPTPGEPGGPMTSPIGIAVDLYLGPFVPWGLSRAGIVFEEPEDATGSKVIALFGRPDEGVARVGPVGRLTETGRTFGRLLGAILAHRDDDRAPLLGDGHVGFVPPTVNRLPAGFVPGRRNKRHLFIDMASLHDCNLTPPPPIGMFSVSRTFTREALDIPPLEVPWREHRHTLFRYDSGSGTYLRIHDGKDVRDPLTGGPVRAANLVLLGRPDEEGIRCMVHSGGKARKAIMIADQDLLIDPSGRPIVLNRGMTWFMCPTNRLMFRDAVDLRSMAASDVP